MRILHADSDDLDNPLRGGQPVRTFEVNSRLADTHDITVLTATYKGSRSQLTRAGVRYRRLGVTVPGWGLSSHLSFQARLPAALRALPHDLVVEEFAPPFGTCRLDRVTSKPIVALVQWFFFDEWERRYRLPFEDIMRRRTQRHPWRDVIVQSSQMGDYFRALLPQANVHVVPCGIADEAFQQAVGRGDYALFLGRLDTRHKGLDSLLSVWSSLHQQGMAIPLWVVGSGQDEAALRERVAALGLDGVVQFKGRLEGAPKRAALAGARFLVMPSRHETFGLVALEAMASGRPVIAFDIPHLNELLQPAWSILAPAEDLRGLAAAVRSAWLNPELCSQLGASGQARARHYTWQNIARMQNAIYLDASRRRPPS